jgi:hypothetical protein
VCHPVSFHFIIKHAVRCALEHPVECLVHPSLSTPSSVPSSSPRVCVRHSTERHFGCLLQAHRRASLRGPRRASRQTRRRASHRTHRRASLRVPRQAFRQTHRRASLCPVKRSVRLTVERPCERPVRLAVESLFERPMLAEISWLLAFSRPNLCVP